MIDPSTGLTKLDLVRYYESVADFILPHLKARPCSLVRGPTGVGGELFFRKHSERTPIPGLRDMDASLWPGHDALLEVPTAAAQMNVIEFHTWNSTSRAIDKPDRVIFDLDPGEGTSWQEIQDAALLVRGFLTQLELAAWLRTSGGKGLHVVVPLTPKHDCDAVNRFSRAVVEHLARVIPSRFVAKSGASNRVGKLFVDSCATAVARPRSGLLGARPAGSRRLDAGRLGVARNPQGRRAVDDRDRPRAPVVPDGRSLGRLLNDEADGGEGDAVAGLLELVKQE